MNTLFPKELNFIFSAYSFWGIRFLRQFLPAKCWKCHHHLIWNSLPDPIYLYLCTRCIEDLPWIDLHYRCSRCGYPTVESHRLGCPLCLEKIWEIDETWCRFRYQDILRIWLLQLKFGRKEHLSPLLGSLLSHKFPSSFWEAIDVIIPVPLHLNRLRQRGFNQSLLLAYYLKIHLKHGGELWQPHWLKRILHTSPQAQLPEEERSMNVYNAFYATPQVKYKRVLLIDDVMTTGYTLNAAAHALKEAGAASVNALVLARTVFENESLQ